MNKKITPLTIRNTPESLTLRRAMSSVQPSTFDEDSNAVRFIAATEAPTKVFDWEEMDIIEEVLLMSGMQLPASGRVPVLDTHSRWQIGDILGSATDFRKTKVEGFEGREPLVTFSGVNKALEAAQLVREGHLTDMSIGYRVLESERIPKGETKTVAGKKYKGPMRVSTKWEVKEVSLTPVGADALAKARGDVFKRNQEDIMKKLRAFLEKMGLPKDATEEQAKRFLDELRKREDLKEETRSELEKLVDEEGDRADLKPEEKKPPEGNRNDPPTGGDPNSQGLVSLEEVQRMINEAVRQSTAQVMQNEHQRQERIRECVRLAGYGGEVADEYIRNGFTIDQARAQIFERMKVENPPLGAGRISVERHEQDKFRAAATSGLLQRAGIPEEKPAQGFEEFRGMPIVDIARLCLERSGVSTRGLNSRRKIADMILSQRGMFTTSDFPSIFMDAAEKRLLKAFKEAPATWRPWVNVVSAPDFKDMYGISLSEAPNLELIDENGEYKTGKFKDKQESYRIASRGKIVYLTRVMIINDDLRAFMRIPRLFGQAARRLEADIVYSLLLSNPTMNEDSKTLFHADHGNLEATAVGTVDTDKLSAGRAAMRKQKGMNDAKLDLMPAFLLTPVDQETSAEVILRSTALPDTQMSSGVHNPWANRLTPISEPRLDDDSVKAWYLVADPGQIDTIEVAYLDGNEQPYLDENEMFEKDAIGYKVRHDFGAGAMEYRGFFKNPGE